MSIIINATNVYIKHVAPSNGGKLMSNMTPRDHATKQASSGANVQDDEPAPQLLDIPANVGTVSDHEMGFETVEAMPTSEHSEGGRSYVPSYSPSVPSSTGNDPDGNNSNIETYENHDGDGNKPPIGAPSKHDVVRTYDDMCRRCVFQVFDAKKETFGPLECITPAFRRKCEYCTQVKQACVAVSEQAIPAAESLIAARLAYDGEPSEENKEQLRIAKANFVSWNRGTGRQGSGRYTR